MKTLGNTVWNRSGSMATSGEVSERGYIAAVSISTLLGLLVSSLVAYNTMGWQMTWASMLLVGLAMPIIGIIIAFRSDQWPVSLFGYGLVVVGLGAIVGPTVALYKTSVVITALMATGGVTLVMSIAGIVYPDLTRGWGKYLFAGLLALIFVRFGQMIAMSFGVPATIADWPLIDYAGALLFSLYIMYDWGRAMELPRTFDNAIDVSVALYLDIANLFINLLSILGGGSSSSN